ncbi:uncharacterized protein LOC107775499 [Nicotiana tabacum]|uniref:Uncharacterized protein LOC107775499 n=1 Tax=Nicotiana tabacum TaxID=4097 RepID=A0A1S3YFC6_TOBAC
MPTREEIPFAQTSGTPAAQPQNLELAHHNHPIYIHPSDTQGSILISIQLQGSENYSIWSRSMKIVLYGENKLGFVLGTCRKEMYDVSLHELWDRCNAIVLAWIMNTVSPSLISTVIYASNAYKVWEDLRERFDKVNASRACYLHKEIATLVQGVSSVSVYFLRLHELWDEYETLDPPPSCGCPESRQYAEHYQVKKLYQFLSGLNKSYENAKNQVLMIRPLPNINQAYAMIVNVESQRKTSGGNASGVGAEIGEHAAFLSNRGTRGGSYRPRNNYGNGKVPLYCEYCKFKGHTKDSCYKLHGYPADFKYKKKGGGRNNYANNVINTNSASSAPDM